MCSMQPVMLYTDAAGGDPSKIKNGIGGYSSGGNWMYMPWSGLIREKRENSEGVKFAHKLCTLEGFRALCGLASMPEETRNRDVLVQCDNMAFVMVYEKKQGSCPYAYMVASPEQCGSRARSQSEGSEDKVVLRSRGSCSRCPEQRE